MKRFENQVAIVTGAGRGIGEAIARRLAEEGARIAVVSRTEANARKTAETISGIAPDLAKPYAVDVADFDAVQKTGEAILADFGRCDVLVNNAGITRDTLIMRMSSEDWDLVVDTNLKGAFNFSRAVLRAMVKQRKGRIINISSVSGLIGLAGQANYAASKAGLVGFTKTLARELASRNITANVVAPGFVETDMTSVLNEECPQGRPGADSIDTLWRGRRHRRGGRLPGEPRGLLHHRSGAGRRWRHEHVIDFSDVPA